MSNRFFTALIVPNIAKPFLVSKDETGSEGLLMASRSLLDAVFNETTLEETTTHLPFAEEPRPEDLLLVYPYSIVAAYLAFNCLFHLTLYIIHPQTPPHPSRIMEEKDKVTEANSNEALPDSEGNDSEGKKQVQNTHSLGLPDVVDNQGEIVKANNKKWISKAFFLGGVIIFMHIYYGLEISFGSFLTTYVVESKSLPIETEAERKGTGVLMTSLYWATFTFVRLTTIFYSDYVGPELNIAGCLVVTLLSNIILVPFGGTSLPCLWAGVALIGAGTSSIWATMFTFVDCYFPVTSRIAAAIIIAACVGEFVFPLVISRLIAIDAQVFLWVILFCTVTISVLFLMTVALARCQFRRIPYVPGAPKSH